MINKQIYEKVRNKIREERYRLDEIIPFKGPIEEEIENRVREEERLKNDFPG